MIPITKIAIFIGSAMLCFTSCNKNVTETVIHPEYKSFYDDYKVKGSFMVLDVSENKYIVYNPDQLNTSYTPASTFKICNSLIGLETGVIPDENYVIKWDSVKRNETWDKDHDLKTAIKNSTVWYYQELARRVGGKKMKTWLDKAHYGNADTSGGIDRFWLTGGLRISPKQQLDFLQQLRNNSLPFSQRSMNIVKEILIVKDTLDYVVRAKTGWGTQNDDDIGWFVGYVETRGKVYYFVNCVQCKGKELNNTQQSINFDHSRKEIAYKLLKQLHIIN